MIMDFDLEFAGLKEVAEASNEGVVIYSLGDKKVFYSNAVAMKLFGLRAGHTQSNIESILEAISPPDREYVRNQYSTLAEKSVTTNVEFRLKTGTGNDVYLCCNAYLVAKASAVVLYSQDTTRSRQYENYLVEFGAKKNTVLHTLMHHMSGALNLMRHLSTEAEKYVQSTNDRQLTVYLTLLNDNNAHCLDMIEDLMKEEHEKSPYVAVKNSKFDVIETVSVVLEELRQSYKHRKFIFEHSADSVYVNSDAVKFLQVVNNFASNAIKFSPASEPILMSVSDNTREVIFSTKDLGIGIPAEFRSVIFERQPGFGRTGLNGEKSIGMGLFICKNLINLLHGKIWFESKEGEGSTFYFSLPKI